MRLANLWTDRSCFSWEIRNFLISKGFRVVREDTSIILKVSPFSFSVICLYRSYQICILLSVFRTVIGTICVTIWAKTTVQECKKSSSVDLFYLYYSKKYKYSIWFMIIWCQCRFKKSICHLVNYLMKHYVLVSFAVYRPIQNTWTGAPLT